MTDLSNRALLVSLNVSQWTARKLDKRETADVTARNGAASNAARVNKSLLPLAASLEAVHTIAGSARTTFYKHSLPWANEGMRVIKADGYLGFTQLMSAHRSDWLKAVDTFVSDYPSLVADAHLLLGGLYRAEDYPNPSDIARKFSMDITFMPVPSANDWRISLGDAEMDSLRRQITAKVQESQGVAMREAWDRLFKAVSSIKERVSDPDKRKFKGLLDCSIELCSILPTLNVADDPNLERMRRELEQSLTGVNSDALNASPAYRSEVADKMTAIMDKMSSFYG